MGRLFRGPFGWTLPSGHTNPVCPRYELPSSYQHGAHIFWALGNTAAGVGIVIHTSRNKVLDTAAHTHTNTLVIDMCLLPSAVNHDVNDSFFTKRVST